MILTVGFHNGCELFLPLITVSCSQHSERKVMPNALLLVSAKTGWAFQNQLKGQHKSTFCVKITPFYAAKSACIV
jgi:hypothetical protein